MEILSRESSSDASYAKVLLVQDDEHFEVEPTENPHRRIAHNKCDKHQTGLLLNCFVPAGAAQTDPGTGGGDLWKQCNGYGQASRGGQAPRPAQQSCQQELENNAGMLHHIFLSDVKAKRTLQVLQNLSNALGELSSSCNVSWTPLLQMSSSFRAAVAAHPCFLLTLCHVITIARHC